MADGQATSPCPLALFVSQADEAKYHYLLSGFFSHGVEPVSNLRKKWRKSEGKNGQSDRWKEKEQEKERNCLLVCSGNWLECSPCPAVCTPLSLGRLFSLSCRFCQKLYAICSHSFPGISYLKRLIKTSEIIRGRGVIRALIESDMTR